MKRVLLLGFVLAIGLAGMAQARPFGPAEEAAYGEAVAWWGQSPTLCGEVVKSVSAPIQEAAGEATQPVESQPVCYLTISPGIVSSPGVLCLVMRHEVGHLLGYGHSTDPASVMFPDSDDLSIVPACLAKQHALERYWVLHDWRARCGHLHGQRERVCWSRLRLHRRALSPITGS